MVVESKGWRLETGVVLSDGGLAKHVQVQVLTQKPHPEKRQVDKARIKDRTRFKGQTGVVGNQDRDQVRSGEW